LGISQTEAHRAVKIDSLSPEAMNAARQVGFADNQSVLIAVAKLPSEEQEAKLREIAAARREQQMLRERQKLKEERQTERERARANPAVMLILEHLGDKIPDLLMAMTQAAADRGGSTSVSMHDIGIASGLGSPPQGAWHDHDWHAAWARREQKV
jgi:hypothetical protein